MYRYISCPNYFGEIVEWFGWAIATWSLSGLAFAIWTFANLAPRAHAHHKWYHKNFKEYPVERKALLPGIW
jgi:protein-S-isoprenylcysteine O-methyltransferase Ste14